MTVNDKLEIVNPKTSPMTETSYYKWLERKAPADIHAIYTKRDYLKDMGFAVGIDKLNPDFIQTLKSIESFYFDRNLRNV